MRKFITLWNSGRVFTNNRLIICKALEVVYTKCDIQCHQFYLSCSILIVNHSVVSPTLNVNPTLFVKKLGHYRFVVLHLLSLTTWLSVQISIIRDNISSQVVDKRQCRFDQWMNSSITYHNICKLIHKKCHPNSCQSDIKYHVTLNIISSLVFKIHKSIQHWIF